MNEITYDPVHHVEMLLEEILGLHDELHEITDRKILTFDEALRVIKWFEVTVVQTMYDPDEKIKCHICNSQK